MCLPIELLIEYFLSLLWVTILCVASVLGFDFSCLGPQTTQIPTPPLQITCIILSLMFIWVIKAFVEDAYFDSLQYYLKFPEGLPVRLRERWVMKILFTSYYWKFDLCGWLLAFWEYIVPDYWHDWTWGLSFNVLFIYLFIVCPCIMLMRSHISWNMIR